MPYLLSDDLMKSDKLKVLGTELVFNEVRGQYESADFSIFAILSPQIVYPNGLAGESNWTVGYYLNDPLRDEPLKGSGPTLEEAEHWLIEGMIKHNDYLLKQSKDLKKFIFKEQRDLDQDEYEKMFPWDKFQVLRTSEVSFFGFGNDPIPKSFFIGGVEFYSEESSSLKRDAEAARLYKAKEGGIVLKLVYPSRALFRGYMEDFPAVWYASTTENVKCLYLCHKTPMSALNSLHEVLSEKVEEGTQASKRLLFLNKILKKDSK